MSEAKVLLERPCMLFLDAGNTVVYLDHDAVAGAARAVNVHVEGAHLLRTEPLAKRRYEDAMKAGASQDEGWHLYMCVLYEAAGVPKDAAARAARAAREAHDAFSLWRLVPAGLVEALKRVLAAGVRCAIISNAEGNISKLFEQLGILSLFEHVVDSGIEGVRKPDPEIFRRALTRAGVDAGTALYAGDIPQVDVDGARGAGMQAVLIDTHDHYPDYRDAPRFKSVAELVDALGV